MDALNRDLREVKGKITAVDADPRFKGLAVRVTIAQYNGEQVSGMSGTLGFRTNGGSSSLSAGSTGWLGHVVIYRLSTERDTGSGPDAGSSLIWTLRTEKDQLIAASINATPDTHLSEMLPEFSTTMAKAGSSTIKSCTASPGSDELQPLDVTVSSTTEKRTLPEFAVSTIAVGCVDYYIYSGLIRRLVRPTQCAHGRSYFYLDILRVGLAPDLLVRLADLPQVASSDLGTNE